MKIIMKSKEGTEKKRKEEKSNKNPHLGCIEYACCMKQQKSKEMVERVRGL